MKPSGQAGAALMVALALAGVGNHRHHGEGPGLPAGRAAIRFAHARLGQPYCWGGTGPYCYDCSGLVMRAYKAAGVSIPRTSQAQWAIERHVPRSHVRPGDLVFFPGADGTPSAPGHVGLVTGRDRMIEAYDAGVPIRVTRFGTPSSPPGDQHPVGFARPAGPGLMVCAA